MTLITWLGIAASIYMVVGCCMFLHLEEDLDWDGFSALVGASIWPVVAYKGVRKYVVENMPAFRKEFKKSFGKEEEK